MKLLVTISITFLFGFGLSFGGGDKTLGKYYSKDRKIAMNGADMVAYFSNQKYTPGKAEIYINYNSVKWLFSTKENADLFKKNITNYLPQYGGYCAVAMATLAKKYSTQPQLFQIVKGKLYLAFNQSNHKKLLKNTEVYIKDADKNWALKFAKEYK